MGILGLNLSNGSGKERRHHMGRWTWRDDGQESWWYHVLCLWGVLYCHPGLFEAFGYHHPLKVVLIYADSVLLTH